MQRIQPSEIHGQNVLFSALNWGYGHVMRSLVLLQKLEKHGNKLYVVGTEEQITLFKTEGLEASYIHLEGYPFQFGGKGNFSLDLFKNRSALKQHFVREQKNVEQLCADFAIDLVIADQSLGFFSRKAPSILITHQVQLPLRWWEKPAQVFYNKQLKNFQQIWIPDFEPPNNLAGKLSYTKRKNARYIGPLSRFDAVPKFNKKYDVGILVTGPQPYAEKFFREMCGRFENSVEHVFIIYNGTNLRTFKNIVIFQHQATAEMAELLCSAKLLITRSGYSTLMDLNALGISNVELHATPGQAEQLYLKKKWLSSKP